jgi:glycerol-3-phosphate dehydrogenase (NAD(P)+)
VLGAGLWGTALADQLARKGACVWLWEFFPELVRRLQRTRRHPHIPNYRLPSSLSVTGDLAAAVRKSDAVIFAVPSIHVRKTARAVRPLLEAAPSIPLLINASKGVEHESLRTMGEVILEEMPFAAGSVYTLSGPSFALEVLHGVPTKLVLAGPAGPQAAAAAHLIDGETLKIDLSTDRVGVELGGSLKNVLAIGCGILDGLKAGANTKAALMTQGIGEMGLMIERLGGQRGTIYGLSGIGDLILTGSSPQSRNWTLGQKLGQGRKLAAALREIPTVAEGVESAQSTHTLIQTSRLHAPLLEAIWRVVHRGAKPAVVVEALGFEQGRRR